MIVIWVRSRNCGCLVTWFCYQLIAKPGNKTAAVSWPDLYDVMIRMESAWSGRNHRSGCWWPGAYLVPCIYNHYDKIGRCVCVRTALAWCLKAVKMIANLSPQGQNGPIFQTTFSNAFSWMKSFVFWFSFHWRLFQRVHLTIIQHWFR